MNQKSELVVISYPLGGSVAQVGERYYVEPTGLRAGIEHVEQVAIDNLRQFVKSVVREVEECANGREWAVDLTVDIGLGPEPIRVAGKLTITIKAS